MLLNKFEPQQLEQINTAAQILCNGGVVAFPTETVYGLGADATNKEAVQKIFEIKQRPTHHPLIVHIGKIDQLSRWTCATPESAWLLATHFWPGPLTLILKRSAKISDNVTGGQDTVGIRIPSHPVAQALLDLIGADKAIAAPSANPYGRISPTTAAHVSTNLNEKVDMILEGGACEIGLESTIISFGDESVAVLRYGAIPVAAIEAVLNKPVIPLKYSAPRVPGTVNAHYAPATPLQLYPAPELFHRANKLAAQHLHIVIITWSTVHASQPTNPYITYIQMSRDPVNYGKHLYAVLHQYDQTAYDYLLVETPPDLPSWFAITDRLIRANHSHR